MRYHDDLVFTNAITLLISYFHIDSDNDDDMRDLAFSLGVLDEDFDKFCAYVRGEDDEV